MKKKQIEENVNRFNPDPSIGLDNETVEYMKAHNKLNVASNPTNKSYLQIVLGNIFTFFNILMIVVAILLLVVVGPKVVTNLMFLGIIFINLLIGTIQECKSKHTIEKLKLLNDSKIKVRRDGKEDEILPSEIVLDDVVILSPGDQIPADCLILEEEIIEVNESLLTGESVPVKKTKGEMVYAGSFVVSGSIAVQAVKIANDTYIQSIESKAKQAKQPKSRLMIAIKKIIRTMAIIAIPLAIIVFLNEFLTKVRQDTLPMWPNFWGEDSALTDAVFYGGTTIAYMIPCGMALLASVAMATGVVKLAQSQTLAQDLYSVESLSRVNTLCLDKTGTLTDGTMTVEDFVIIDKKYKAEEIEQLIASYQSAFKATNQTSTAIINRFGKESHHEIVDTIQFSSARKYSAVKFKDLGWFVFGAPDYLTKDKDVLEQVNEHAKNGLRVVLLAKVDEEFADPEVLPNKKQNVAMFIIRDTIRPEVKGTMEWFAENDVDIKVISGDNIGTVSYIAKQSGIKNWDKVVDLSKLSPEDNFESIVMNNSIFGRVSPDQKADIIAVLKKNGRVTGVTGDGLNDLLAFKQADCSIALANGAAATKNVANLILLDSNFANMKEAVFQGRRVVNNIQRSSSLFVMKDFLWLFITIMPILLGLPHIIQPTVMTVVNIFITGIASLFVALEPDKTRVKGNFFRNVVERALSGGFFMFIPVILIMLYYIASSLGRTGTIDLEGMRTVFSGPIGPGNSITSFGWVPVMSLCITIAGFIIFFGNCRPFTKFRKVLFAATLFVVLVVLYLVPEFFIISGTELLQNTGGFAGTMQYIFTHIGWNATFGLYRTMTLEQGLFVLGFAVIAYPLYLLNAKFAKWMFDKLFAHR
nr:HAD-IC family P-type ATPase [Bacilli bacterium]